jgi:hypothetical protein
MATGRRFVFIFRRGYHRKHRVAEGTIKRGMRRKVTTKREADTHGFMHHERAEI